MTIAIVEGDAAVRDSFDILLNCAGYGVRTFENGLSFLTALPTSTVQCVLAASALPDMSAAEMLKSMREAGNNIPAISMGNNFRDLSGLIMPQIEFAGHLLKPVDEGELFAMLEDVIANHLMDNC